MNLSVWPHLERLLGRAQMEIGGVLTFGLKLSEVRLDIYRSDHVTVLQAIPGNNPSITGA